LGLNGEVTRDAFLALAFNKVPGTEEKLTVRTKGKRTPGYDFCYSVPKSVSVYLALSGDPAVKRMIHEALRETMVDVEARMETRVRGADEGGNQRDENRTTGNMVYAAFVLPLAQAGKFSLFRVESIALSVGDTIRITKNFRAGGTRFRNNELHTVTAVEAGKITLDCGALPNRGALHLDQGIVVTSHASQGKTVSQVVVSIPVQ
jgi:TrwC relaxase